MCAITADNKVIQGWGSQNNTGSVPQTGESSIGVAKKNAAAAYWDNKTEELDIPDVDTGDFVDAGAVGGSDYVAPPKVESKMVDLSELNKEFTYNVPSTTPDGIDISLLTCQIRPIVDLIETDMFWDYTSLQAEIGQNFRERYGKDTDKIEGTVANNI